MGISHQSINLEKEFGQHLLGCVEDLYIMLKLMEQHTDVFRHLSGEQKKLNTKAKLLQSCDILVKICSEF